MDLLTLSQIIFNVVISLAVITVGVVVLVLVYEISKTVRSITLFFESIRQKSNGLYKYLDMAGSSLYSLYLIWNSIRKKKSDK